jgi:hypothetical protein
LPYYNNYNYTVIILVEIRLKTVERAQVDRRHRIWSNIVQVGHFFPNWPNFTQIGAEKTNHGSNFGQLGRYSTKIVAEIQLRTEKITVYNLPAEHDQFIFRL